MYGSEEQNKETIERLVKEVVAAGGNIERADAFFHEDFVQHGPFIPSGYPPGLRGWKRTMELVRAGFPDIQGPNDIVMAEGNLVCNVATAVRGTHSGSGRRIEVMGMHVTRFEDGKIAEQWSIYDNIKLMDMLGVLPTLPKGIEWFGMPQQD